MSSKVDKIAVSKEDSSIATGVVVNGETIPADAIVMVCPSRFFL
jgi:hypothetical protein